MKVRFDHEGSRDALGRLAAELMADDDVQGLLVMACDGNGWVAADLDPMIRAFEKPVFGGIFPQIIYEQKNYEQGTLVIGLPMRPDVACVRGLSDLDADYDAQLETYADAWPSNDEQSTLVVFVDGLSKRIAALVQSLFSIFGLEWNFIGGGAGSLSFEQKPCLFAPEGLLMDAAVVARLPIPSGVGVAHGWLPISAGMKVTEADRNTIQSLEWRPAFETYRALVEADSGVVFTKDNFFDLAKRYPFGIGKFGTEVVVRDPLLVDADGGLVCVGEVPQGCTVKILKGTHETLVAAAAHARERAEVSASQPMDSEPIAFLVDCISRVLFLGDGIVEEFAAAAAGRDLFGILTLGEIANNGQDYLEFYNKTVVLGLLG